MSSLRLELSDRLDSSLRSGTYLSRLGGEFSRRLGGEGSLRLGGEALLAYGLAGRRSCLSSREEYLAGAARLSCDPEKLVAISAPLIERPFSAF